MRGIGSLEQPDAPFQPEPFGVFLIVFTLALGLSLLLTPLARRLGERIGIVAEPGGRRAHRGKISQLGGLSIYLAFILTIIASQQFVINPLFDQPWLPDGFFIYRFDPKEFFRLIGLLGSVTIIFVVGLIDDWLELPPLPLYIAQLVAGGFAILFLILIEYVNNPLTGQQTEDFPYLLTIFVTLLWLGTMTNTVNFLDGLDGLAAGVVAIACVILFVNAAFRLEPAQHSVAVFPLALLGATLGFLPYNLLSGKIFLGSGAYFLGFSLGVLSIIGGAKAASILLVMGLPLLDLVWQIVNRVSRGQNPMTGDRGHLHYRLADLGLADKTIVLGYYVFCALFGGLALFIPSQLYKLIAIIVMGLICIAGFFWLAQSNPTATPQTQPNKSK